MDVSVRYYEFEVTKLEYDRLVEIQDQFNIDQDESPHDETPAVRFVDEARNEDRMEDLNLVTFIVKSHLEEEWEHVFYAGMKEWVRK